MVIASERWHPGIIGIVASKLVDMYYRPVMLISMKNGIGKGSGRSISEFNLHEALKICGPLLISHGGHRFAAGISIQQEKIEDFRELFTSLAARALKISELMPQSYVDARCTLSQVDADLISQLSCIEPFGSMILNPFCMPAMCSFLHYRLSATGTFAFEHRMRGYREVQSGLVKATI